eukprot:8553823-Pyramimonas_sp.AAC.1
MRSERSPRGVTKIGAFSPDLSWKGSGARTVRACSWGRCWRTCARSTTPRSPPETRATPTLQAFKLGPTISSQGWTR